MARFSRRRKRPIQNGVNAIFSGKARGGIFSTRVPSDELELGSNLHNLTPNSSGEPGKESRIRVSKVLVSVFLIGLGLTIIGSGPIISSGPPRVVGPIGPNPRSTVRAVDRVPPVFQGLSNINEAMVTSGGSYSGTTLLDVGDFLVVQVAYSQGSIGNLPDINNVVGNASIVYSRTASASPGVGLNFWEQVWTGRAPSASTSASVTVIPGWTDCQSPCVTAIIVSMTIARYRDVRSTGASAIVALNASSASQAASISVGQPESVLVELLSHGAYNSCGSDAAQPVSGQTSRNCITGTTERTELFDHMVSSTQTRNESYAWSQVEVQRGIYLELDG